MHDAASQVIVAALEGPRMTNAERLFFTSERPGGVIYFKRNIASTQSDLALLTEDLQSTRGDDPDMLVCIDQEGGRVARLGPPFPNLGPALRLANGGQKLDDLQQIESYGVTVAESLLALGVNVNFAPVCDVLTQDETDAIGDRCFGTEPDAVSMRAGAFLKGMAQGGVAGCLKHFPGQGAATFDTHEVSCPVDLEEAVLFQREVKAFTPLIQRAPMVMMSHCIYPAIDDAAASLSSKWMQDILREQLNFQGLIVSDDMLMGAIPQDLNLWKDRVVEAVRHGCELVLVCRHIERAAAAVKALRAEAAASVEFKERLEKAANRVYKFRQNLGSIAID